MTDDSNSSSSSRAQQFDEILAELMCAIDKGESVARDKWLTQHPEFTAELEEFIAKHERLEKLVRPLRQAAANVLHVRCPHCHNPIELLDQAPLSDISCPSCGSSFSLICDNTLSHDLRTKSFGHFELIDRVGIGQFGSVWKARDTKLDRTVAIKIPRNGRMDSTQTEMFLRDARAAAQLKHPNIVSVHEVGKQDDTVYIVSDFIQGATLKEWTDAKRLTPREAAELCVKIAKALHHAHEAGVIHRDLKPSNIMMDTDGEPHLVDFGLAKREAGEITMTVEGQILGTPAYMSPEQARGEGFQADRRADIYSLGVILFELLTGELPFRGDKQMLLVQILKDEPPSPRKLNSSAPRDLETICLKCLAKERAKRYESGLSLAHDLERFLFGEPIHARPVGRLERTTRWCQRHPQVASLLTLTAMLLIAVAGVATWGYFREAELRGNLERSYGDLTDEQKRTAQLQHDVQQLENRRKQLDSDLASGKQDLESGKQQLETVNRQAYDNYLQLAHAAWSDESVELADYYLHQCPQQFREQDWKQLRGKVRPLVETFKGRRCVAISPDDRLIAGAGDNNSVLVWEVESGRLLHTLEHGDEVNAVAFSADGTLLASGGGIRVVLWNPSSGDRLRDLAGHVSLVTDLDFSPDGKRLVSAAYSAAPRQQTSGELRLWDLESFESQLRLGMRIASFSPEGDRLITLREVEGDPRSSYRPQIAVVIPVQMNDDSDSAATRVPQLDIADTSGLSFHPLKNQLAVSDPYGDLKLWDCSSQKVLQQFSTYDNIDVNLIQISPDGSRLAYAGSTHVDGVRSEKYLAVICNLVTGKNERVLPWYTSSVKDLAFTADGNRVATATDTEITLWEIARVHDPTEKILTDIVTMDVGPLDWPQWGGSPSRINTPVGKNIPLDWDVGVGVGRPHPLRGRPRSHPRVLGGHVPINSRNVKWATPLGSQTYANPVVANGRIFVGTNNGAGYLKRYPRNIDLGVLLCFEEETGEFLWQDSNEKLATGRVHDWPQQGVCSTPVVDGNRLWYVSNRGEVVCLDTEGFHDGEDDGPAKAGLAHIFNLMRNEDANADKVAPAVKLLNNGAFPLSLREGLADRGIGLPETVQVETLKEDKRWSMTAKIGDAEREFRIAIAGPQLKVFKQLTTEDLDEADVVWRFDMMNELGVSQHNMANCSMLTVDGMLLVCTSNGLDESHIKLPAPDAPSFMAMDRDTGKVLWTDNSPGKNILHGQWASPSYGVFDGQPQVIFPGGDAWVYSFDPQGDGKGGSKLLWKFDGNPKASKWILGGRGTRNYIISFPGIYDGLVYIVMGQDPDEGEGPGLLWCIDPTKRTDGSDVSAELAVNRDGEVIPHRRLQAVDVSKGERAVINPDSAAVWDYSHEDLNGDGDIGFEEEFHRSMCIPVIKDDILYIPDYSGLFHCLNAKTGKLYWTYDMLAQCWGSPLLVDGKVYIGDEDGDVLVFRHLRNPKVAMQAVRRGGSVEFEPVVGGSRYEILREFNMRDPIYMTPIVANNVLYIATRDTLYAIQETHGRPIVKE